MSEETIFTKADYMGPSPLTLLRDSSDLIISNTIAETEVFSYTIESGGLAGDHGVRITLWGYLVNASGGTIITTFRFKLGATLLWEDTEGFGTSGTNRPFQIQVDLFAKDSDAVQEMVGHFSINQAATTAAGEGGISAGAAVEAIIYGEAIEDATLPLDFVITAEMDTAHAAGVITRRRALVEQL